ncbi:MAG: hypothetical protein JWR35_2960 [Marmoricola sp.]|nr:hypothetical protein [Marmoricola sp.]
MLSVVPPTGWEIIRGEPSTGGPSSICLAPQGNPHPLFGCGGVRIYYGQHLPGANASDYRAGEAAGWYSATDVQPCPIGQASAGNHLNGVTVGAKFENGLRPVGDHKASWNKWTATCKDGSRFTPQAWFLPTSKVLILDYLDHPETAAILNSAKFASDGAPLPPMPTYLTAHVKIVSGLTFTVRPFRTYGNDAAGKAYAVAHHLSYPFDDDYYDAPAGPTREITVDGNATCTGNVVLTQQNATNPDVPCNAFARHPGIPAGFWLRPGTNLAESVFEIFRP